MFQPKRAAAGLCLLAAAAGSLLHASDPAPSRELAQQLTQLLDAIFNKHEHTGG